jgi:hypothetical protein
LDVSRNPAVAEQGAGRPRLSAGADLSAAK